MATVAFATGQGFGSSALARSETLQAQRVAAQAESTAHALRQRSVEAQRVADRAEANASSIRAQADRAEGNARTAQQQLSNLQSGRASSQRFGQLYGRIAAAGPGTGLAVKDVQAPVTTGTVVNTSA